MNGLVHCEQCGIPRSAGSAKLCRTCYRENARVRKVFDDHSRRMRDLILRGQDAAAEMVALYKQMAREQAAHELAQLHLLQQRLEHLRTIERLK